MKVAGLPLSTSPWIVPLWLRGGEGHAVLGLDTSDAADLFAGALMLLPGGSTHVANIPALFARLREPGAAYEARVRIRRYRVALLRPFCVGDPQDASTLVCVSAQETLTLPLMAPTVEIAREAARELQRRSGQTLPWTAVSTERGLGHRDGRGRRGARTTFERAFAEAVNADLRLERSIDDLHDGLPKRLRARPSTV